MTRHSFVLGAALFAAAFVGACSTDDVLPGDGNESTASGPGSGGMPLSLANQGAAGDWCPGNTTPQLAVIIGTDSDCSTAPGPEPQINFAASSAGTSTLAAGQSWSYGENNPNANLAANWFADGISGNHEPAKSASLEVLSVEGTTAKFRYAFVTQAGQPYAGEATVTVCAVDPPCM
ncbi:hypothetical protein [Polyangium jinanense]|uniref:Lipoprotein n=1 Tax=Polyangium jinanense TaxID=2829994 RepID=A0A9X4AWI7_9BACT|nr:hypothetical protein [Polyangium jinanense]MDC3960963.1 hypothetical protein [Polyangium jinanense]MDC3987383.1 hypothetical protein [Polyangium jinanense]